MVKGRISFVKDAKKKKKSRRDEENILSKDIDIDEEMRFLEKMTEKSGVQREMSNINYSKSFIKNLKFKPQKYKGTYLPYHLRWIFGNSMKNNEISLVQEVKALETEIIRLKQIKLLNREFRRIAGIQISQNAKFCACCKKNEPRNHTCPHNFCKEDCVRKKVEAQFASSFSNRTGHRQTRGLYSDKGAFGEYQRKERKFLFATKKESYNQYLDDLKAEEQYRLSKSIFIIKKIPKNEEMAEILKKRQIHNKSDIKIEIENTSSYEENESNSYNENEEYEESEE